MKGPAPEKIISYYVGSLNSKICVLIFWSKVGILLFLVGILLSLAGKLLSLAGIFQVWWAFFQVWRAFYQVWRAFWKVWQVLHFRVCLFVCCSYVNF